MVPTVDMQKEDAPQAVTNSLIQYGFAVIVNHGIPTNELEALYNEWDAFFLSDETSEFTTDPVTFAGYYAPDHAETAKGHEAQDIKEYFQYWPGTRLPESVREVTLKYYDDVFELGKDILTWLQENTEPDLWRHIDQPLNSYLSPEQTLLRILRYPPFTGSEAPGAIRAGAHEDINLITLLPAANEPGLEIKPRGSDWQPVKAAPGSIIINIGDMLQELTRGELPSTTHRVVNPEGASLDKARLTAPVFCHPFPAMVLSERYTAESYLRERLNEINTDDLKPVT